MKTGLLLSGGIDSTAVAAWKRPDVAYTIDYGQVSSAGEIRAAIAVAREFRIAHEILRVDCRSLGSGDLALRPALPIAPIPEWWPYRNQLIVTIAAMRAVADGVTDLLLGTVRGDVAHADGRPEFFKKLDELLGLQEGHLRVRCPALELSAVELVQKSGITLPVLAWSHSCHVADVACGDCRGCWKRTEVFATVFNEAV